MTEDNLKNSKSNNERIAKNTLFLYFRMFILMAVSLYTSRVVLRTLGIQDYGIYNVVGGIVAMVGRNNCDIPEFMGHWAQWKKDCTCSINKLYYNGTASKLNTLC